MKPSSARPAAAADELVLLPGQWHFGMRPLRLRTLLGSCVAITVWHPQMRAGGMCHFLLPERRRQPDTPLEGRYGDEAVALMVREQQRIGTRPQDYVAHLYGGADTMPDSAGVKLNIGQRNIEAGWALIDRYGFRLDGVDVGDQVPRTVTLDIGTGDVTMHRAPGRAAPAPATFHQVHA